MHTARISIPERRRRPSRTSDRTHPKYPTRARESSVPRRLQRQERRSYRHFLRSQHGTGNFPATIEWGSTRSHQRQPGAAVSIGNATLPKTAARGDPANPESLFGQPNGNCPYAHPSRSVCGPAGSCHDIPRRFPRCHYAEGCFFASRTNIQFSRETRILL